MPFSQTVYLGVPVQGNTLNPAGAFGLVYDASIPGYIDPSLSLWRQSGAPFGSVQTLHSVASGALPPGVTIAQPPDGILIGFSVNQFGIAGIPEAVGVYTGSFAASGAFGGDTFSITVALVPGCPTIGITPATLPDGVVDDAYLETLTGDAGDAPYVFDILGGSLPPGLELSPEGELSGAPEADGTYEFTIRLVDDNGCTAVQAYTMDVIVLPAVTLTPEALESFARLVDAEDQAVGAEGGDGGPYTFTVVDGELPEGLILEADGTFSGFPRVAGPFTVTIRATDSGGHFGEQEYELTVTGLRIVIAGVDRSVEVEAADFELALNRRSSAHLLIGDGYVPSRGEDVLIYEKDAVTPAFGGLVLTRRLRGQAAGSTANQADVDCVDYSFYFDDAEVSLAYAAPVAVEDVIAAIVDQVLDDYGITYTPVATARTLDPFTWTAITVTDAVKRIWEATGVVVRVLPLKELIAFVPLTDAAPVTITDANINAFDLSWADGADLASDVVDLLCGPTGNGIATQRWTVAALEASWEVDIQAVVGGDQAARAASAFLGASANYSAGETVTLGSSTYTFRASLVGDVAGEVLVGASAEDSLGNLAAAITGAGGGGYAPSTPVNADASAYVRLPDQLAAQALVAGAAGNAIAIAATAANSYWYGQGGIPIAFLQLGADASGANGWTQGYVLEDGAVARPIGAPGSGAYYEWDATVGRGTLAVGGGSTAPAGTELELAYLAVFPFHARYPTPAPAAARTYRETHPEIVSYADGVALAEDIYGRESGDRRDLEVVTDVDGFLPGQALTVDTTHRDGLDAVFLIATVRVGIINDTEWDYRLTSQEAAAYQGSYVEQWKALTSGGSSSATAAPTTMPAPVLTSGTIDGVLFTGTGSIRTFVGPARLFLGGNPTRFVSDMAFVDLPGGFEFEIDGDNLAMLSLCVEANGWVEATAAATATFQLQYWNGSGWTDITGATVAIAMTTRNTRYWNKGSAFTAPSGVHRVKAQIKGNVGAAAMVSGAVWIASVAA